VRAALVMNGLMLFVIVVMFFNVLTMFVVPGAAAGGVGISAGGPGAAANGVEISAEGPGGVPTALRFPPRAREGCQRR